MSSFISDPEQLQKGIFKSVVARQGVQTNLNVNYLPDLVQHIQSLLSSEEVLRLQKSHLQNYIVELAINYSGQRQLDSLVKHILLHIRNSNDFWYRHNNQKVLNEEQKLKHNAIQAYQDDDAKLKENFKDQVVNMKIYQPEYPRRTSENFSFNLLHQIVEPHFGTRCCLNHLAHVPRFIMDKYQNAEEKGQEQMETEKYLEECVMFVLSNKKTKSSKKKIVSDSSNREEEESESESENRQVEEVEHRKTILDEFKQFIEKVPFIPAFQSSSHMCLMTLNILKIVELLLRYGRRQKITEEKMKKFQPKAHRTQDSLEIIQIGSNAEDILAKLTQTELEDHEVDTIVLRFQQLWRQKLKYVSQDFERRYQTELLKGWISSQDQIEKIKAEYQEMLSRPQFVELTQYRASGSSIPWKDEEYHRFLKGLYEFFNVPTNNKKIAAFMGTKIEPNHVKHVKAIYLSAMKDRIERGECGGGRRGKCFGKAEFLERDISSFSMKWFEKSKKIKKKKPKRRRRLSQSEPDEDVDSDF